MKTILGFCACIGLAATVLATPPNTPVLDGQPIEYDATDRRASFEGESAWGAIGTLTNLFVTWDATNLYVALQAWQADNNKLVVLIDVDPDAGTGATTTTNWTSIDPSYIKYNDYGWVDGSGSFGLDYMAASEGFFNNTIRILYDGVDVPSTNNTESLFDHGNGTTPVGSPVDMASLNDATACPHKGFEVRIPWAVLYEGTRWGDVEPGETVPRGASLRLLAGIHNNNPDSAWSSPDTIPNQTVSNYVEGIVTTADYIDVLVDSNNDGIPDMLAGDVNAPYIRAAAGAVGGSSIYVAFNEAVTVGTVENTANWTVGGATPSSATAQGTQGVLLGLAAPIASADLLLIVADGVEDAAANSRATEHCLFPSESGISQPVDVTFQVFTNSGMGISVSNARPTAFFINGSALPLEWGYPPLETTPLASIPGSNGWVSATVTFPAGTPSELFYKYSGRINGTNNFEAIRLTDYADASRSLLLNDSGTPITVVEHLGAAAHPLRNPASTNVPSAHNRLYTDPRRGDAGVRVRREILFQLDLSMRKRDNLARVFVAGSDPLRGFNTTGVDNPAASDYPGVYVAWTNAGIQLFDDGTHGDAAADDGIYSRLWAFSTNGVDSATETNLPHSLVGGRYADWISDIPGTEPYLGEWINGRSPRSLIYKFYAVTAAGTPHESPSSNIELYVRDPEDPSLITLDPFVWDNEALPAPPPSNAPALSAISLAGTTATLEFENILTEGAHGVRISTNLLGNVEEFQDYGHRATPGITNEGLRQWSASIAEITPTKEFYAPYAGPEPDARPLYWEPNVIAAGATSWRVYFCQFQTNLKGMRSMSLTGNFAGWGTGSNMVFLGDGLWMADIDLAEAADGSGLEFKPRGGPAFTWLDGGNFKAVRGTGGASWSPMPPVPGELVTISLDVAGTPLAAATNVNLHHGFDNWQGVTSPPMTNTAGTVWAYSFIVPAERSLSIDWVFNGYAGGPQIWYSAGDWRAFMSPYYSP
jgi:hypothetical protein